MQNQVNTDQTRLQSLVKLELFFQWQHLLLFVPTRSIQKIFNHLLGHFVVRHTCSFATGKFVHILAEEIFTITWADPQLEYI